MLPLLLHARQERDETRVLAQRIEVWIIGERGITRTSRVGGHFEPVDRLLRLV